MNKTSYLAFKKTIQATGKTFFSVGDIKKFYTQKKDSLPVLLSNWNKNGWINNLGRGYYTFNLSKVDYFNLANILDSSSYVSFEYALYYYNLIDQVPTVITLATKQRSRQIKMGSYIFEYTRLKNDLFFEIELKNKIYIATPEKALVDLIYLISRGKRMVDLRSLEKEKINQRRLKSVLGKFPKYTAKKAEELGLI